MASVSMSMQVPNAAITQKRLLQPPSSDSFFKPLPVRKSKGIMVNSKKLNKVESSLKEKAITGLTAAALTASMVVPDVAEAASGVSPSLKNFLLSIVAGGVVLGGILAAIIGVSNFDPVKRN